MADAHTTALGETWDMIALDAYGSDHAFEAILDANPLLADVMIFGEGAELSIPEEEKAESGGVATDQARWREMMADA